jgi:hypothetical protein
MKTVEQIIAEMSECNVAPDTIDQEITSLEKELTIYVSQGVDSHVHTNPRAV